MINEISHERNVFIKCTYLFGKLKYTSHVIDLHIILFCFQWHCNFIEMMNQNIYTHFDIRFITFLSLFKNRRSRPVSVFFIICNDNK